MRRTNVYLEDDQLRALKHLAADSNRSVAAHVREAVDEYLTRRLVDDATWRQRFEAVVARIRSQLPAGVPAAEIEADIAAARDDRRRERRAATGG